MTRAKYVCIAAAYLAIMLLSLLAYCREWLRVKGCTYIIWTRQKFIPFLSEKLKQLNFQKILSSNFQVLWKGIKNSDHSFHFTFSNLNLNMKTVFPVLELAQICCIKICEHFFVENWQFNHKLTLLNTYQDCPYNLTKY